MIGSNNILNNEVIHRKPTITSIRFCQLYNVKNRLEIIPSLVSQLERLAKFMMDKVAEKSNSFTGIYMIRKKIMLENKNDSFTLYQISRHKIKSMYRNKLILIEQHFRTNGHNSDKNPKLTIIERIKTYINMKFIIEKKVSQMKKKPEYICTILI